jgi:hypothetical protein
MIWSRGIIILTLIIIGALLATGCTSPNPSPAQVVKDEDSPSSVLTTTVGIPMTTPVQIICPPQNNSEFIRISPVSNYTMGEHIIIEGTTNLAKGEKIAILLTIDSPRHCPKSAKSYNDTVDWCCGGLHDVVEVVSGNCGINQWSWDVNTSLHEISPHSYIIYAYGKNDLVEDAESFEILGIPKPY